VRGDAGEFLPAMSRAEMRRIRGERAIIVRYEPAHWARCRSCSPPGRPGRLPDLVQRLLGDERMRARRLTDENLARIAAILAVLGAAPIPPAN